ncbi:MAG: UxaA family hydrolase [Sphingomonadales bacterium]|nr:UxaA family hydrolase [Sphingomonadales bacterium]
MPEPQQPGSGLILLHSDDNVLIAARMLAAGTAVSIDGMNVALPTAIDVGHKVARRALKRGEKVSRYGAPIGTMSEPVAQGGHVHSHNLKSDYIPAHDRNAVHQSKEEG